MALLQTVFLLQIVAPDYFLIYAESINYFSRFYRLVMYLVLGAIILIEIRDLGEFHIDKFTITTFILSSFLRQRSGIIGDEFFLIFIALVGVSIIFALIIVKPKIVGTNIRWTLASITIGIIAIIVITLLELFFRESWQLTPPFAGNLTATVISHIVRQFSLGALTEEILFRGFLWGYLRRRNWAETQICWAQGALFWLMHFSRVITPFTFFFTIPLLALISSILTFRTKQLFPAILFHTVINVLSALLNLATY